MSKPEKLPPSNPQRRLAQAREGGVAFRAVALPAVAAALRPGSPESPRRKPTIHDFPAFLRQDTALD